MTQMTAASLHGLWSSAENVKSTIHPATHQPDTLSLQGTEGWCPSLHPVRRVPMDPSHAATGQMRNGSCAKAMSAHIPKARKISRSPLQRQRGLFNETAGGDIPQNPAVLDKTATPPVASLYVQHSALSQAPGELSPCQHCSRTEIPTRCWPGWGCSTMKSSVDTARALHQNSLG